MRGEHELEGDTPGCARDRCRAGAGVRKTVECGTEGLARDPTFLAVAPPPARPMMLLGDVGQLEVDGERPENTRLVRLWQTPDLGDDVRLLRDLLPCIARTKADALDRCQQLLALLLDDHLP